MALAEVKEYFKGYGMEDKILLFEESSATVEMAAERLQVIPARIAKTLSFRSGNSCMLVVTLAIKRSTMPSSRRSFQ